MFNVLMALKRMYVNPWTMYTYSNVFTFNNAPFPEIKVQPNVCL